ncbi:hypothetical protein D6D12_04912 [Aureobasidium pullulans]|uniref:Uncharacterized protein n=1 Tax=Aureobasidium pullulans TaxID=5580 RepID=A0AB74JTH1_AURPU|nr:hypothetical protein D6D12_04912 [Aureobasidium pullulans]THX56607.1 hypothetical protein D6D11_03471 [Aureobasidium pullulans]
MSAESHGRMTPDLHNTVDFHNDIITSIPTLPSTLAPSTEPSSSTTKRSQHLGADRLPTPFLYKHPLSFLFLNTHARHTTQNMSTIRPVPPEEPQATPTTSAPAAPPPPSLFGGPYTPSPAAADTSAPSTPTTTATLTPNGRHRASSPPRSFSGPPPSPGWSTFEMSGMLPTSATLAARAAMRQPQDWPDI